jgi:hypothetical protein
MLTFEGQKFQGAQAIVTKLTGLAFGICKITLATQDFQPSISGGILVFTTGIIQVPWGGDLEEGRVRSTPRSARQVRHALRRMCSPCARAGSKVDPSHIPTPFVLMPSVCMCMRVQTEAESTPLKFSQVFHLMPVSSSFIVTNGELPLGPRHPRWLEGGEGRRPPRSLTIFST